MNFKIDFSSCSFYAEPLELSRQRLRCIYFETDDDDMSEITKIWMGTDIMSSVVQSTAGTCLIKLVNMMYLLCRSTLY